MRSNHAVPVVDDGFVHLFMIFEWSIAVFDNVGVLQVQIRSEEGFARHFAEVLSTFSIE